MSKSIKAFSNNRFNVELIQASDDVYTIKYENFKFGEPVYSENITDFNTASFLFDLKIEELEGQ